MTSDVSLIIFCGVFILTIIILTIIAIKYEKKLMGYLFVSKNDDTYIWRFELLDNSKLSEIENRKNVTFRVIKEE